MNMSMLSNIKKSVCSISLVVLAVSDLIVLYTGLLRQWIYMVFDVDIRKLGPAICVPVRVPLTSFETSPTPYRI
jgi:hypothetical protein